MGQGFSVAASKLAAGSEDITALLGRCEAIASDAVTALGAMAGAAGHAGLSSALTGAGDQGAKTFLDASAAYQHVSGNLSASATTYATTEQNLTEAIGAIGGAGR